MPMVELDYVDNIAIVRINNPPMNVLCTALLKELEASIDQIQDDNRARAVVITGEGRAFVAGADIKEMKDMGREEALEFASLGQRVLNKIEAMSIPVIAAVNGFALGGGTELAMACDIRIASEAAKFGQPEVNLGVIPGFGGTQRLPRLIGMGKAKELIYTGDIIDANEALRIGLVQRVVEGYKRNDNGEIIKNEKGKPIQDNTPVVNAAIEMAKKIASKGPIAIKYAKSVINEGVNLTLQEGLKIESERFAALFATKDQKEGMKAFIEKRTPEFRGE